MMEAGYDGLGNDAAELFDRTADRRILPRCLVPAFDGLDRG
jgi:hypothetical protein